MIQCSKEQIQISLFGSVGGRPPTDIFIQHSTHIIHSTYIQKVNSETMITHIKMSG